MSLGGTRQVGWGLVIREPLSQPAMLVQRSHSLAAIRHGSGMAVRNEIQATNQQPNDD